MKKYLFYFITLLFFVECAKNKEESDKIEPKYIPFIRWDRQTLTCIDTKGYYPRMRQLKDKSLVVVYEDGQGNILLKKSDNKGNSWGNAVIIYRYFEVANQIGRTIVKIANPELVELPNGDLLLVCNLRPAKDRIYPYSIALKRSVDKGQTWTEAKILYQAGKEVKNGCWEPSFLLLPDNRLQIYFANEGTYTQTDEQEISVLTSSDNGENWSTLPKRVSFRRGHRDGMPVAVQDGKNIFVAIEDNISGEFKPYIVKGEVVSSWQDFVTGESSNRYMALKDQLLAPIYAGAPYIIYTQEGFYVLSYQTTQGRNSQWEFSEMEVVISRTPDNFINPTRPFEVPLDKQAKWNSLTDLGDREIMALSSTNFSSQDSEIWAIKGEIVLKNN
jgi:hypothetical protein